MEEMLIKMVDGGIIKYDDDFCSYGGCPTCNYGSEYITEIDIELTKYKIHIKTNQMYEYVISEGQMMRLFLTKYNEIQNMKEEEFIEWFKKEIREITHDEFEENMCNRTIEKFNITKKE